ncbi:MAG: M73 family secreted endopeptidase [Candidatus Methanohalarchaeum thermophilum]|uniref:M73 family secreted endopeptidase n=1 Tax=Methanohalarchaeum thermophilum TaxID=1903181 RepID=A0A1Q6DXJ5_METT1|nr:MAG: M73 family secreted endopeptidase [Candidatus Methanohalarchaeum thermophilum]
MNISKSFLAGLVIVGLVSMTIGYGTMAFFTDSEKATGNELQAGTIDIMVNDGNPWKETFNLNDIKASEMYQKYSNVTITNVGTNDARVCKVINITGYDGGAHPVSEQATDPDNTVNKISAAIEYWLSVEIYDEDGNLVEENELLSGHLLLGIDGEEYVLGVIPPGGWANVTQRYHMFNETTNWAQGDNMTFDMTFIAQQVNDPDACGTCKTIETMYLSDSGPGGEGADDGTRIFEVVLDDEDTRAYLNQLTHVNSGEFDQVDSLSASLDGKELYLYDKDTKKLGTYDLINETFTVEDITDSDIDDLNGVVLGAVNPEDGLIYAADDGSDKLLTINSSNLNVEVLGELDIDVQGADLIFDAQGILILYTNADNAFYEIDIENLTGDELVTPSPSPDYFTGISIREAGNGDLVGSTNGFNGADGYIWTVDRDSGVAVGYEPYIGMTPHTVGYGDMAVGVLCTSIDDTPNN